MGRHPHAGLTAITYLAPDSRPKTGAAVLQPWDNFDGYTAKNHAGGLYIIETGRGCVHEEVNETTEGLMHQLQLWVNPGLADEAAAAPAPRRQLFLPAQIPVVRTSDLTCRVLVGSAFGGTSPARPPIPLLYLHMRLAPGATTSIDIPADLDGGFAFILQGSGDFTRVLVWSHIGLRLDDESHLDALIRAISRNHRGCNGSAARRGSAEPADFSIPLCSPSHEPLP